MAFLKAFWLQLSVLLLSSFTGIADDLDSVVWTHSPHHSPTYPPVETPKPAKRHHPGHHHHRTQPPSHTPVRPPPQAYPPVETPKPAKHHHPGHHHHRTQPPSHTPVHPPPQAYPPVETPKPAKNHHPGHHHHRTQSPSHPPVYLPPLGHPPSTNPDHTRKLVAVQGVVYCKPCKYIGKDTLWQAAPLAGAVVRLQFNNTKYPMEVRAKTDKNGYFLIMPQKLTTDGSHKCKVFLVSSPLAACNNPTDFNAGYKGSILMATAKPPIPFEGPLPSPQPFELFTVGPFAFEPTKPC